jgi:hypothetical protein
VNELRTAVDPDVRLQAEVPLFAFRGLINLRAAFALFILCRTRRPNNRRIDDRSPAANSWIAVWVIHAYLATLVETSGVLDAVALAIVLCGAETLLVGVERPREEEYDHTEKHGYKDQQVLHRSSHLVPP